MLFSFLPAAVATVSDFMETGEAATLTSATTNVALSTTISNTGVDIAGAAGNFELGVYLSADDLSESTEDPPTPIVDGIAYSPGDATQLAAELISGGTLTITGNADIALPTGRTDCESVAFVCVKLTHAGSVYSKCYAASTNCGKICYFDDV